LATLVITIFSHTVANCVMIQFVKYWTSWAQVLWGETGIPYTKKTNAYTWWLLSLTK